MKCFELSIGDVIDREINMRNYCFSSVKLFYMFDLDQQILKNSNDISTTLVAVPEIAGSVKPPHYVRHILLVEQGCLHMLYMRYNLH